MNWRKLRIKNQEISLLRTVGKGSHKFKARSYRKSRKPDQVPNLISNHPLDLDMENIAVVRKVQTENRKNIYHLY